MRDEEIIDELIKCVELLASAPSMATNPSLPVIQASLIKIKAARLMSKKKFADYFVNLSTIVKQISEIKV